MTNSALEIWKEVYINGEVSDDTSFVAIDLLLNGFSSKEKKRILNEVFSTFKSTFVAYRFIYFNFIKDDIPDDEQVKVVNPYDLTSLYVKNDDDFQKRTKTQTQGFVYGVSTCPYCNSAVYDNREDFFYAFDEVINDYKKQYYSLLSKDIEIYNKLLVGNYAC